MAVRGNGGLGHIRLVDRHGHNLGRLRIVIRLRCRYNDVSFPICGDLLDRQRAGSSLYSDIFPVAFLYGIADHDTSIFTISRCFYALVRIAVGNGNIIGSDGLRILFDDCHSNGLCLKRKVILIFRNSDIYLHCSRIRAGGQNAAVQCTAIILTADFIGNGTLCTI